MGQACGVAEYTRYLCEKLPEAEVVAESPEPSHARLVHLQHENALYDDGRLAADVARLREAGARVVVTEHTVTPAMRAWERDADVLVALKATGAAVLKKRWPAKRVEHIPCGCPEYFPPRKRDLGKVIGAFGFAAGYKGFDRLFELQPALPGSQLLIYSHDHGNPAPHISAEQIDGRAVRLITGFMPTDEIATRLAAEADVLVFWYKPVGFLGASSAVRIGLSTGVPVMTSPTAWFDDLKEVTYQPADPLDGVRRLLEDTELRQRLVSAARDYCHENSWARIAQRHRSLWESLDIA
jgi:glycosyltransferase involved in cell wall biosynthesis